MANKDPVNYDPQNSESSESLSPDEWTMIDENCSEKDDNEDDVNNSDANVYDKQNISRSIEVLQVFVNDEIDDNTESAIVEKQGEDSDGISVITESDAEQSADRKNFVKMEKCQDHHLFMALNQYEKLGEKSAPQAGTILNVVIACSLAAIIGLGTGRILGMDDKCPVSNSIDFPTIKIESDMLIDQIKELGEVKSALDEIKASIPQMKETREKVSYQRAKSRSKRAERRAKKSLKISKTFNFEADNTILEQLQTSLNALSSVIDEIKPENEIVSSETSRTREIVLDLIKFKEIVDTVLGELENTGEEKELEFFRNAEKKIREVCESLLGDLTRTIHGLTTKMHNKLNRVRHKLNKRLCLLKISEPIDRSMFKPLEEKNSFLESCDNFLKAPLKPQTIKIEKKKMYNKKIRPLKISLNNSSDIKPFDSDDNYSRYSSSDSSMPDLTYNQDNGNEFLKEKRNSRRKEKNNKHKSGKKSSRLDKSIDHTKSNEAHQNRKNLIMDVTEVEGTCLVTHKPQCDLQTPEERPLYSSIVKSINKDTKSKRNNLEKRYPDRKEFRIESLEKKKILTETKHNVTPAESGVNVSQKAKNTKKQGNNNVRERIVEYHDVSRLEKIPQHKETASERHEDSQQAVNIEKNSSPATPPESDVKNKKSNNNSEKAGESKERQESTIDYAHKGGRVAGEKYKKKSTYHDDDKKSKKEKVGRRNSTSPKITATKIERDVKNRNDKQKANGQFASDWQLKRSRARELHRDRDHRSEWFFDRADYRQDARTNINEAEQRAEYCWKGKCQPILEEGTQNEKYSDDWFESKETKARKHSGGRAGFTAKKQIKMPHRKDIFQSKHY